MSDIRQEDIQRPASRLGRVILIIFGVLFGIFVLLNVALYVYETRPWKIKDPSNPRFDASKFDPNDYRGGKEIAPVLAKLLRPGISTRTDADMLWCKTTPCGRRMPFNQIIDLTTIRCLGEPNQTDKNSLFFYTELGNTPIFGAWDLWLIFDDNEKLITGCIRQEPIFPASGQLP